MNACDLITRSADDSDPDCARRGAAKALLASPHSDMPDPGSADNYDLCSVTTSLRLADR